MGVCQTYSIKLRESDERESQSDRNHYNSGTTKEREIRRKKWMKLMDKRE